MPNTRFDSKSFNPQAFGHYVKILPNPKQNALAKSGGAGEIRQTVKLFVSPEFEIKAGCKIEVTQNGKTLLFKSSGEPARYETHQEIMLEPFERGA